MIGHTLISRDHPACSFFLPSSSSSFDYSSHSSITPPSLTPSILPPPFLLILTLSFSSPSLPSPTTVSTTNTSLPSSPPPPNPPSPSLLHVLHLLHLLLHLFLHSLPFFFLPHYVSVLLPPPPYRASLLRRELFT